MKKADIRVGERYVARVSDILVYVRVDAIRESLNRSDKGRIVFDVTNLKTGRKLVFQSAAKFREHVPG